MFGPKARSLFKEEGINSWRPEKQKGQALSPRLAVIAPS